MKLDFTSIKKLFLTYNNPKRKAHILKEFEEYELTEVNPFSGIERYSSGASGFIRMLNKGSEIKPFKPFLMLEDDVKKYREFPETLEIPDDADILYIGLSKAGIIMGNTVDSVLGGVIYESVNSELIRIYNMCTTHGFIICSEKGLEITYKCMEISYKNNIGWDIPLTKNQPSMNVYALKVPLVYQWKELGGEEDSTKIEYH